MTCPFVAELTFGPTAALQRLRARDHFDDLARNRRLADLVHVERQTDSIISAEFFVAVSIAVICAA